MRTYRKSIAHLLPTLVVAASLIGTAQAGVVLLGSDYLETLPGTTFGGAPFAGVPIGPGNTDTIVQRLNDANLPSLGSSTTIPTQMVELRLVTTVPVNFGLGVGFYYMTLQSVRGGPSTVGSMTITWNSADDHAPNTPEGTFNSFFDVFFDIRFGALNGPIALSDDLILSQSGSFWDADPPAGKVIVNGPVGNQNANLHTGKTSSQMDFFPRLDEPDLSQ
jgi:hypothetical protein